MEDPITKEQFSLLRELVDLCGGDVTTPVSVFAAAMKARLDKKKAQHVVLSLLETDMCHDFNCDFTVRLTNKGIMYCEHRRGNFIVCLWHTHTESIIRGCIGACGAITGSIITLAIKAWLAHKGMR